MGAQFPIPVALSIRQPPVDHDPGAGHRLSRHLHASGQESRLLEKDSPHGRGNTDPAVWFRTKPEYSLPHVVPRRGVRLPPRWIGSISLGQFTDHRTFCGCPKLAEFAAYSRFTGGRLGHFSDSWPSKLSVRFLAFSPHILLSVPLDHTGGQGHKPRL